MVGSFEVAQETDGCLHRLARIVFSLSKVRFGYQVLVACVDEVIEDLCFRTFCNPNDAGELAVAVPAEAFRDIRRS